MNKPTKLSATTALVSTLAIATAAYAATQPSAPKPPAADDSKATEQWEPVPPVVTPGATDGAPPSDAIVLFDGHNLDPWQMTNDHTPAHWKVADGVITVDKTAGNIETKQSFRNYQLHLEWRIPKNITGEGQHRGNSGVFLASTGPGDTGYEVQILDSYNNKTYVNGQAAAVYKQSAPLVNSMRAPGAWQTFDIIWTAPVFAADGKVTSPAYVTVLQNGVLVQNHFRLTGETTNSGTLPFKPYQEAPIKLQAHGDPSPPISFRNIWVRKLPAQ
jgi:alpha-3'-ketoglucosidase